jgi:hypothetical protein
VTLRPAFSLINSEFNDFLFASIGDEKNGMPLSVMSALTRLDVDPWEQAAQLSALPRGLAASTLAPMIARLPTGNWGASDAKSIATRLVRLLPMPRAVAPSGRQGPRHKIVSSQTTLWLICFLLATVGFVTIAMNGELRRSRDRVSAPVSDMASPPQSKQ